MGNRYPLNDSMTTVLGRITKGRIYYGWYIVLAIFLLGFGKAGFTGYVFSLFLKPMSQEFGWSRTAMSGAVTLGTVLAAATGYLAGKAVDKYGSRIPMSAAVLLAGVAFLGLGFVNGMLSFYLLYGLGRTVTQSMLGDTMTAAVISKWFLGRRGFAIALGTMGQALAGTILAVVCQILIDTYSWRHAWFFLGILTFCVALGPAIVLLRRTPEDMGLEIYGGHGKRQEPGSDPSRYLTPNRPSSDYSFTFSRAIHTSAFWVVAVAEALVSFTGTAIIFHLIPLLTDSGIPSKAAAGSLGLFALGQASTVLVWGALADRTSIKATMLITVVLSGLASFMLLLTHNVLMAYLSACLLGLALGGFHNTAHVVWATYFGRQHLGSIRGATLALSLMANATGPLAAAMVFDISGSYQLLLISVLVLYAFVLMLLTQARQPRPS